ncbi:MAG: YggS family pyridoxal phosphate-dependent enzyme [Actinomycetota bacterium]|nr:YggS family pyridoxal phosphate-dependent enzyme [Actinomycetota bacterium]
MASKMFWMQVYENIRTIREKIERAAMRSGRSADDVTLVAVTKNQPVEAIMQLLTTGIIDLGENRSQELISKKGALEERINWHFIGHLQRNKVRYIIPFVYLIQSVDSMALAREISAEAKRINKVQDVLLEVNVSGEATKHGFAPDEVAQALNELVLLDNVRVKGLMTMAPLEDDAELTRPHFAKLKKLYDSISSRQERNIEMEYLSMGMSNDFEVAIEEGSNMVRIGTAIFI